jgi:hypothetical protein
MIISELKQNLNKLNEISRNTNLQEINLFIDKNKETMFAQVYDLERPDSLWNLLETEKISHFIARSGEMWVENIHSLILTEPDGRFKFTGYKRDNPPDWMRSKYGETTINKVTDALNNILDLFEVAYNNGFRGSLDKTGFHFS